MAQGIEQLQALVDPRLKVADSVRQASTPPGALHPGQRLLCSRRPAGAREEREERSGRGGASGAEQGWAGEAAL